MLLAFLNGMPVSITHSTVDILPMTKSQGIPPLTRRVSCFTGDCENAVKPFPSYVASAGRHPEPLGHVSWFLRQGKYSTYVDKRQWEFFSA